MVVKLVNFSTVLVKVAKYKRTAWICNYFWSKGSKFRDIVSLHGDIMQHACVREKDLQRIWQTRTTHAHIFKFVVDTHTCKKKNKTNISDP